MPIFAPTRLTVARQRRLLSKKDLAEIVGVTPHSILRYESGESAPTDDVVARLVRALDFPNEFFFQPEIDTPPDTSASFRPVSFRSMSAMSAKERDAALAAGALAFVLSDWVEQRFDLPAPDVPDLTGDTPEVAARALREAWGLGEQPIKNMAHLLESKGVRLFSLAENTVTVDAFSMWRGELPYLFLNTMKTAERSRLDAAHELGHLTLHRHGGPKGRTAEEQANTFASAFLMPEADVLATIPRVHTLNQVIQAKARWGVSAIALIHRLHKLKIMSAWQYRTFCIDATEAGYRQAEPFGIPREKSVVWQKVLTALWSERMTRDELARALHFPTSEIENLLFGLVGGSQDGASTTVRPPLRLIS